MAGRLMVLDVLITVLLVVLLVAFVVNAAMLAWYLTRDD